MEDEGDVIEFIKYDIEPIFEYTLYIMGIVIIMFGALSSIYIGFKEKGGEKNADVITPTSVSPIIFPVIMTDFNGLQ